RGNREEQEGEEHVPPRLDDRGGKVPQDVVRERRALLAAGTIQRVVPGGYHSLQVGNHARIDLVRAGTREIRGHFAVLGRKRRDLARRQRPDAGALHPERGCAERLPALAFFLDEALCRNRDAAGRARFGGRGKPAAAPALLLGEDGHEIALQVRVAARHEQLEPAHEVGRDADLHLGRQVVDSTQEPIEQAELFLRQLRRAGLDRLGVGHGQYRRAETPVRGVIAHYDRAGRHISWALVARVEDHREQGGGERNREVTVDEA